MRGTLSRVDEMLLERLKEAAQEEALRWLLQATRDPAEDVADGGAQEGESEDDNDGADE